MSANDAIAPPRGFPGVKLARVRSWAPWAVLAVGALLIVIPTFQRIAQVSWATEQGAHGPIVLAIALWLLGRRIPALRAHAKPGSVSIGGMLLVGALVTYVVTHIVGSVTLESASMYAIAIATLYLLIGARAMSLAWFPILYFLFVLPPPGSWVATATQPLRLEISELAVHVLALIGYPVARSGLLIYVDQYVLEVKAACGGLNSIISLSAIGLFYAYIRHAANWRYMAFLFVVIVAMAILANFVRVLILILITYHLGDAAAQGFLHDFAGFLMFAVAMAGVLAVDGLAGPLRKKLRGVAHG